jgi:hypothetical protein
MTPDIADIIAGELGVSRGTAYDMMREALADASPLDPCCWPGTSCNTQKPWAGLTKTVVGNHLRRHALGDQPTFRQGFKEGVAFAELKLKEGNI